MKLNHPLPIRDSLCDALPFPVNAEVQANARTRQVGTGAGYVNAHVAFFARSWCQERVPGLPLLAPDRS
jgi:hypothetical protein